MRYLGIDYGLRKIGLAIGDSETNFAIPLEVVFCQNQDEALDKISEIIQQEFIDELVIGLPLPVAGHKESEQLIKTKAFVKKLEEMEYQVSTIDESYTSFASQQLQKESQTDVEEDALAAMMILQSFFDEQKK